MGGSVNVSTSGANGHASMDTTAYGSKGNMRFVADVVKTNGEWQFRYLAIYPNGVKVLKVDPSGKP